ncbi:Protein GrpE [archaeon HR01]|nr:Protein GrpE [archaeon HR01]
MSGEAVDERLKKLEEENKSLKESILYLQSELANMRRLMDKEMDRVRLSTLERVFSRLITIYQDFGRVLEGLRSASNPFTTAEGFAMLYRELEGLLKSEGVERMEVLGKPFNPFEHEAVEYVEGEKDEDVIVEEIEPGYRLGDRVLKPPKVKVARRRATS